MLVLTRKQNEKIRIGESIVITVVRMKGKAVRLGIEAPSDVNILRGELAFEARANNSEAENSKAENSESIVDDSLAQATRGKTASRGAAGADRNPACDWSGGRRDERGSSSWPTALTDTVL